MEKGDEDGVTSTNQVVYTDFNGEVYVAVQNGAVYNAAAASRPGSVGRYLKVKASFVAYLTRTGAGTTESPYSYSNNLAEADAGVKAARAGETHHFTLDMSGRGKIGADANAMYAATFNSTNAEVTASSTPAATATIAANTVSKTASQTLVINADGSIADSSTFYVGLDGSNYSCNVTAGMNITAFNEDEYNASTNPGANTAVAISWID